MKTQPPAQENNIRTNKKTNNNPFSISVSWAKCSNSGCHPSHVQPKPFGSSPVHVLMGLGLPDMPGVHLAPSLNKRRAVDGQNPAPAGMKEPPWICNHPQSLWRITSIKQKTNRAHQERRMINSPSEVAPLIWNQNVRCSHLKPSRLLVENLGPPMPSANQRLQRMFVLAFKKTDGTLQNTHHLPSGFPFKASSGGAPSKMTH